MQKVRVVLTVDPLIRRVCLLKTFDHLSVIGLREWVALPDLGVTGLRAKIDTGASTSTLHATEVEQFERNGEFWVRFNAHLGTPSKLRHRRCEAPLVTVKRIKSSNGHAQARYVIRTPLALGFASGKWNLPWHAVKACATDV